jgi:glucose-6-phosphate isomerase
MSASDNAVRIVDPGRLAPDHVRALAALEKDNIIRRIWDRDWTVWKPVDREISDRLGWLDAPESAEGLVPDLEAFVASVRGQGLTRAVVLGMGGSSLAPDVFSRLFDTAPGFLDLEILDTTEPGTVAAAGARLAPDATLFIVSSKSGTTAEVMALLSFFYDRSRLALGSGHAGSRFVAVTDPGTPLEALARDLGFRRVFRGQPDIGGRFSALSAFGLVPAAIKGIDARRLLVSARSMAEACRGERAADNPGALLGAVLGTAALKGMDKLTFLLPPRLGPLGAWLEQLVAESTGKEGRGIIPVVEDRPGPAASYGRDRLFVEIGSQPGAGGKSGRHEPPFVRISFDDPHDLGGQFFLWEFATAVAGHLLKINPFDQPDVESTKNKTKDILSAAGDEAGSAGPVHAPTAEKVRVAGPAPSARPDSALSKLLGGRRDGDYLALLAFLPRRPAVEELLSGLAAGLRIKTGLPVTVGFGPRYLHSTGQLHKGDGNRGLFLVLVASDLPEVGIPAVKGIARPAKGFKALFEAQAEGDARALAEKGRRILTIELAGPAEEALASLSSVLE